jgi:hypothetical protein
VRSLLMLGVERVGLGEPFWGGGADWSWGSLGVVMRFEMVWCAQPVSAQWAARVVVRSASNSRWCGSLFVTLGSSGVWRLRTRRVLLWGGRQ